MSEEKKTERTDGRNDNGQFVKGLWKGGPGRKTKDKDETYRAWFKGIINYDRFNAVVYKLYLNATGKRINMASGTVEDDPRATPHSETYAGRVLMEFVLPLPKQQVELTGDDELKEAFRELFAEHPDARDLVIEQARKIIQTGSSVGENGT